MIMHPSFVSSIRYCTIACVPYRAIHTSCNISLSPLNPTKRSTIINTRPFSKTKRTTPMSTQAAKPFPSSTIPSSLVTPEWLKQNLNNVTVLDATWYVPNTTDKIAVQEFQAERIPGSKFFDLDGIADTSINLPHMLPSEEQFSAAATALGVHTNDLPIVIYDRKGIFSSPRAWWTWHVFGHTHVAVLDGGYSAWKSCGGEIETTPVSIEEIMKPTKAVHSIAAKDTTAKADETSSRSAQVYRAALQTDQVRSWHQVLDNITSNKETVMDARPAARFQGRAPEPRAGLKMGHIPGSLNIPFAAVLNENGTMKTKEELERVFADAGVDLLSMKKGLIASCGSGTTACILKMAVERVVGSEVPVAVYDGSWSEWGGLHDVPVD